MRIKAIEVGHISLPLVHPFKTALRTVEAVEDVVVRVVSDDGTVGYGEAPPPPLSPATPPRPSSVPSGSISAPPWWGWM